MLQDFISISTQILGINNSFEFLQQPCKPRSPLAPMYPGGSATKTTYKLAHYHGFRSLLAPCQGLSLRDGERKQHNRIIIDQGYSSQGTQAFTVCENGLSVKTKMSRPSMKLCFSNSVWPFSHTVILEGFAEKSVPSVPAVNISLCAGRGVE